MPNNAYFRTVAKAKKNMSQTKASADNSLTRKAENKRKDRATSLAFIALMERRYPTGRIYYHF